MRPGFGRAGTVAAAVSRRCHAIWLLTRSDILQVGADVPVARRNRQGGLNPDFGAAGAYPFLSMGDGLAWRHRGAAGNVVFLMSANRTSPPIEFDFVTGKLLLDPATMTTIGSGIQTATRDLAFAPSFTAAGAITGLAGSGWIQWQSVRVGAGLFASNGVASKL